MTFVLVTSAKFYRNLSFCLTNFHSFFKMILQICISNTTCYFYWLTSIVWKNDRLKSSVTLIRTLSTEQWISDVIDCVNVSAGKEDTWTSDVNSCTVSTDISYIWKLLTFLALFKIWYVHKDKVDFCETTMECSEWMSFHVCEILFKLEQVSAYYCKMFRRAHFFVDTVYNGWRRNVWCGRRDIQVKRSWKEVI